MGINDQQQRSGDSTPSLIQTIDAIISRRLLRLNTCMPGRIIGYNETTQRATVQPLFDKVFPDGEQIRLRPIANVPVQFPRSMDSFIHFPIDEGTPCLLVFSQRALDRWNESGDCVDPEFNRIMDVSDAIAIPGVSSEGQAFDPGNGNNLIISNGDARIELAPGGGISYSNADEELVSILVDLVASIRAATTQTLLGPQNLIDPSDPGFSMIEERLSTFLTE